jgi:CheY-like chemotaxis protein
MISRSLQSISILCVDDDWQMLEILKAMLEPFGATIHTAISADEALRLFNQCQADIVICDIGLPETDGIILMQRIRSQSSGTAAIALTGISNYQVRERAFDAGFDRYLVKPVPDFILIETICKLAPQGI